MITTTVQNIKNIKNYGTEEELQKTLDKVRN